MHQKLAGKTESGLGCSLVRVRESEVQGTSSKMSSNMFEYGRMAWAWSTESGTSWSGICREIRKPESDQQELNEVTEAGAGGAH